LALSRLMRRIAISRSHGTHGSRIMFGAIYAAEGSSPEAVLAVAQEFSPRVDAVTDNRAFDVAQAREIVLDLNGLARLFGDARTIAEELRRTAADRGLQIRVAIASTRTAARLMVRHRAGLSIIEPGTEAAALAPLPLALLGELANVNSQLPTPDSQPLPTPNSQTRAKKLGVGNWEWLGVGNWELEIQKVTPALTPNVRGLPISPMKPDGAS
jgi:hypothetical protein